MINPNMIDMLTTKGITVLVGLGFFSLTVVMFGIVAILYALGFSFKRRRK